jgi:signal transduction histidine kinase
VAIELDITGETNPQDSAVNIAVYRIIQEAVTNAVRHGNASRISVKLDYSKESIRFYAADNGVGSDNVKEGYGLKGIRERVEAFGGKVEIESGDGFCIKGILYLEGKK